MKATHLQFCSSLHRKTLHLYFDKVEYTQEICLSRYDPLWATEWPCAHTAYSDKHSQVLEARRLSSWDFSPDVRGILGTYLTASLPQCGQSSGVSFLGRKHPRSLCRQGRNWELQACFQGSFWNSTWWKPIIMKYWNLWCLRRKSKEMFTVGTFDIYWLPSSGQRHG